MKRRNIPKNKPIYADSAEPQRIEEIRRAGFGILPADKDVEKGIDSVKSRKGQAPFLLWIREWDAWFAR